MILLAVLAVLFIAALPFVFVRLAAAFTVAWYKIAPSFVFAAVMVTLAIILQVGGQ